MTRGEVEDFLGKGKLILRLATVNAHGDPEIQPVWYDYSNGSLYLMTGPGSRKVRNIKNRNTVYFSVDTEIVPYKGVKGKGNATIVKDERKALEVVEKIVVKYLGSTQNPMAKRYINSVRSGTEVVVEIAPRFYSVWDYSKSS